MSKLNFTPEQRRAIAALKGNVIVSAGAGSGKTRVMVERYLGLLEAQRQAQKGSQANLVAITFTKKAAGELKERLRQELGRRSLEEPQERDFWQRQQRELERAQISTIHGLCTRLLREQAAVLGLDPDFQVADEVEAAYWVGQWVDSFFACRYREQDADLDLLVQAYGGGAVKGQLRLLLAKAADLAALGDLAAPYQAYIQAESWRYAALAAELDDLRGRVADFTGKTGGDFLQYLQENWPELEGELERQQGLSAVEELFSKKPSNGNLAKALKAAKVGDHLAELHKLQADQAALPLLPAYSCLLASLAAYVEGEKQARNLVTYDDLEVKALELLQNHSEVRHHYQQLFAHIMVDEFQDTNLRQKELIYWLCGDDGQQLQGDKLYVVGDPKQSIYRFRGADVGVFADVRQELCQQDSRNLISMQDNFRSSKEVLAAVRAAFAPLLGTDPGKTVYFEPLVGHFSCGEKPVFYQLVYDQQLKGDKRLLEARALARELKRLRQQPYLITREDGTREEQPVQLGKVAVLLPRFTHVAELAQAFREEGLPFTVQNGRDFYLQQEVLDILNICRALLHKYENLALAGALRSPYFGLDDASLTQLFTGLPKGGSLEEALCQAQPAAFQQQGLLKRAQDLVAELSTAAALLGPREFYQLLWERLKIPAVLSAQEEGEQKLANVKKLGRLLSAYVGRTGGGLADFLTYVKQLLEYGSRETEANLEAEEAVTLLTVHGAKGLEFDTVVLPQLDGEGGRDREVVRFSQELGLGIKVPGEDGELVETSVFADIKEEAGKLEQAESLRLLYVAMTRAKYRLLLSGTYQRGKKPGQAKTWYNLLQPVLGQAEEVEGRQLELADYQEAGQPEAGAARQEADQSLVQPLPEAASTSQSFSPTSIATYLSCPRRYFYRYVALLPEVEAAGQGGGGGMAAALLGSVCHKSLELLRLPAGLGEEERKAAVAEAYARALRELAPEHVGSQAAAAGEELLQTYVASQLYRSLPEERQRELSLQWWEGELPFQGIIDCLYLDAEGRCQLVDFKSGRAPAGQVLPLAYAYQLSLYARGVQQVYGYQEVEGSLHFLRGPVALGLPAGRDYGEEALALAREISAKEAREEDYPPDPEARYCSACPYNYLCPQFAKVFSQSLQEAQEWAASVGYKEGDVDEIIKDVRNRSRK